MCRDPCLPKPREQVQGILQSSPRSMPPLSIQVFYPYMMLKIQLIYNLAILLLQQLMNERYFHLRRVNVQFYDDKVILIELGE
jgi:hypothetical protein